MLSHPSQCWLVIVSTVSGLSFQFRLQIATLDGGKGDKPYKIMMARFILQEIVAWLSALI
jgi:hypothetical protein